VFPKHCFVFQELFVVFADMGPRMRPIIFFIHSLCQITQDCYNNLAHYIVLH